MHVRKLNAVWFEGLLICSSSPLGRVLERRLKPVYYLKIVEYKTISDSYKEPAIGSSLLRESQQTEQIGKNI